ncbi:hypothetical protein ALC56_13707 [Trachymyrmex septentrionalis]|uniref:Uncharacterized protein n=1 Tax=Trachymyrmex septentrionalis TaxID=34720 RepID=A0A195EVN7_9HYME|nr:hypothetical protein ALC56_13707 [Trachymyrmex septentrionalis]
MQTTEAYPPRSRFIGFIAVYGNVPTRRATTVSTSTTLKDSTVMATYKRYEVLYRNHDFLARRLSSEDTRTFSAKADAKGERIGVKSSGREQNVAPLPSEKVPLPRVPTGKNFSASMHSKCRSAGKPTRAEGPKGLIKGLYRSQPGRRALISLVHPARSIRSP